MVFFLTTAPLTTLSVPHLPKPSSLLHTHTHTMRFSPSFQEGLMKTHARNSLILWSCLYFSLSHKHCFVYTKRCRNAAILILVSNLSNTFVFSKRDRTFLFFLSWGSSWFKKSVKSSQCTLQNAQYLGSYWVRHTCSYGLLSITMQAQLPIHEGIVLWYMRVVTIILLQIDKTTIQESLSKVGML